MKKSVLEYSFLIGLVLSIPSFADSMVCDANGNCTLVHTSTSSTSSTGGQSTTPPPTSGMEGVATQGYAEAMAAKAAAEKAQCPYIQQQINKAYSDCETPVVSAYNQGVQSCPPSKDIVVKTGISSAGGATIGYSRETTINPGQDCLNRFKIVYDTSSAFCSKLQEDAQKSIPSFCK